MPQFSVWEVAIGEFCAGFLWAVLAHVAGEAFARAVRFPPSVLSGNYGYWRDVPPVVKIPIAGCVFGFTALVAPQIAFWGAVFLTALSMVFFLGSASVLAVERHKARDLGRGEPGMDGTPSYSEAAGWLALAAVFGLPGICFLVFSALSLARGAAGDAETGVVLGVPALLMAAMGLGFARFAWPGKMAGIGRHGFGKLAQKQAKKLGIGETFVVQNGAGNYEVFMAGRGCGHVHLSVEEAMGCGG